LTSWYRSWTTSAEAAGVDDPRTHELHDVLLARQPDPGPVRIVHGDYGFHNCLVVPEGRVAAVVDWEVATLGDARADLAFVLNRWSVDGAELPGREELTMPPSFPSIAEAIEIYRARTGTDLGHLDYFISFNHWRSACIAHGVYTRYVRGQKPADGVDVEGFRRAVEARLTAAMESAASI
jgi:aminoglycoside phosphotransferase (APT) family kinase protein